MKKPIDEGRDGGLHEGTPAGNVTAFVPRWRKEPVRREPPVSDDQASGDGRPDDDDPGPSAA